MMSDEKTMGQVIQIDEARIRDHLGEMVRGTVEETLNAMLDTELIGYAAPGASICRKEPQHKAGGLPREAAAGKGQTKPAAPGTL
jgi:hypothetical protein